jgi:hypothetical protein
MLLAAPTNVPEAKWPDCAGLDRAALVRFSTYSSWVFVQIWGPGEESLSESSIELPPHLAIGVKIAKGPSPLVQANRW